MEDIEDMKALWIELNNRLNSLEEENRRLAKKVTSNKYKNVQEKLIKKYCIFIAVSCVMMIYCFCLIYLNPFIVEKYKLLTTVYMMCFFAIAAGVDSYLLFQVRDMDFYNSNVREITKMAAKNWKIHKIFLIFGLPLAIGACVLMALALDADPFVYLGMIVGGIVGFIIGLRQLMKFRDYYKLLQTEDFNIE